MSQVMKARAAANVPRAVPGPTATCLFALDVCLGLGVGRLPDAGAEFHARNFVSVGRCRFHDCHLRKVRLNGMARL